MRKTMPWSIASEEFRTVLVPSKGGSIRTTPSHWIFRLSCGDMSPRTTLCWRTTKQSVVEMYGIQFIFQVRTPFVCFASVSRAQRCSKHDQLSPRSKSIGIHRAHVCSLQCVCCKSNKCRSHRQICYLPLAQCKCTVHTAHTCIVWMGMCLKCGSAQIENQNFNNASWRRCTLSHETS